MHERWIVGTGEQMTDRWPFSWPLIPDFSFGGIFGESKIILTFEACSENATYVHEFFERGRSEAYMIGRGLSVSSLA